MEVKKKKTFFIPEGEKGLSSLETFFQECGLESASKEDASLLVGENVRFSSVNWNSIEKAPVAFIKDTDLERDIPRLILKRFFGGEGALAVEENYQESLLSLATLKILDGRSLGSFSDILASEAGAEGLSLALVRNFSVQLFSFIDYLAQKELAEYPLEIDYGRSQDCFFLQAHCEDLGIFFENLLESVSESEIKSPFVSMLREMTEKTNFLEIYKLKNSQKLVLTAVWNIIEDEIPKSSLVIHQIDRFHEISNAKVNFDVKTFFSTDTDRLNKIRAIEKTPQKLNLLEKNKELYNPALVKRVVSFLKRKKELVEGIQSGAIDQKSLVKEIGHFPDKEALKGMSDHDVEQILRIIAEDDQDINEQAENIKDQIPEDDYVEGILNSLSKMTAEEAKSAAGFDREDIQVILGQKEDLGEETTRVKGAKDNDENSITRVKGSGEGNTKEEITRIKGVSENFKDEPWHTKRLAVTDKVKEKLSSLKASGASRKEIDLEVKKIMVEELNLKEDEGDQFVSALSDDLTDDWVRGGIDPINESIKHKVKFEKAQGQIQSRDNQIKKMKTLIDQMKGELIKKQKQLDEAKAGKEASSETESDDQVELKEKMRAMQREMQGLENQLAKSKTEQEREKRKEELDAQKSHSKDTANVASGDEETEAKLRELQRAYQALENDLARSQGENQRLTRKGELEKEKSSSSKKETSKEEGNTHKDQLNELQRAFQGLENDLTKSETEKERLKKKIELESEKLNEFQAKGESANKEREESEEKLRELKRAFSGLENDLSKKEEEKNRLQKKMELEHKKLKEDIRAATAAANESHEGENSLEAKPEQGPSDSLETQNNELHKTIDSISNQKDQVDAKLREAKKEILESEQSGKKHKAEAKQSLLALEKEVYKIKNDLTRALNENELLARKFKEAQGEIGEIKGNGDDVESIKRENTNLSSQVESLKKRLSFMYENTKSKNDITMDASDIDKILEENNTFKKLQADKTKEIEKLRDEKRELEQNARKKQAELDRLKSDEKSAKKSPEDRKEIIEKTKEAEKYKNELKKAADEMKALQLKQKSYEQKIKFMSAQLDKNAGQKAGGAGSNASPKETQLAAKLKHSEKTAARLKDAADKLNKELGEKKTELHKMKMEKKALENKVKELERKVGGKKAA